LTLFHFKKYTDTNLMRKLLYFLTCAIMLICLTGMTEDTLKPIHQKQTIRKVDSLNNWVEINIEHESFKSQLTSKKALVLAQSINYLKGETESLINLGWINYRQDNYDKALEYSLEAYLKASQLNEPRTNIRAAFNIGAIYSDGSKDHLSALRYMQYAYDESEKINDDIYTIRAANNIAYLQLVLGNFESALHTLDELTLRKGDKFTPLFHGFSHRTYGDIYLAQGKNKKALEHFLKAYSMLKKANSMSSLVSCNVRLGKLYLERGEFERAEKYLKEGIAISLDQEYKDHTVALFKDLAILNEKQENWEEAYNYKKQYSAWSDSLSSQINSKNMGRMEAKFDFDQKLQEVNSKIKNNELMAQEQLKKQIYKRNIFVYASGFMLCLIVISMISLRRIRKAKAAAEQANNAKSDFISVMSHEIRTPLNGVIGFSELLSSTPLNNEQQQYVGLINQSAHSLIDIINDILDFSKIEAGKMKMELSPANLETLGSSSIDLIAFQAYQKNVSLNFTITKETPPLVLADELRLKQVMINLLGNAIKFTEKGEIELKIEKILDLERNYCLIRFSVRDTGIGISEHNKEKIFDAFSQEDNSTTRKYGGTGLGLTISNRILALMGSKLALISDLGSGSTFFCDIKLEQLDYTPDIFSKTGEEIADSASMTEYEAAELLLNLEVNILIAEDNPVNMLLTKKLVKQFMPKAQLFEAPDGKEAVNIFLKKNIDLILMDIQMPNLNGYEATQKIRQMQGENSLLPIIALTAGALPGEREKCLQAGLNDYATKPLDKKILLNLLSKHLLVPIQK